VCEAEVRHRVLAIGAARFHSRAEAPNDHRAAHTRRATDFKLKLDRPVSERAALADVRYEAFSTEVRSRADVALDRRFPTWGRPLSRDRLDLCDRIDMMAFPHRLHPLSDGWPFSDKIVTMLHGRLDLPDTRVFYSQFPHYPLVSISDD
jgi:hypothetical protein